jgi:hypothetical protein
MVGAGINITVWNCVDQLNISVLADDRTLPEPHEATAAMVRFAPPNARLLYANLE